MKYPVHRHILAGILAVFGAVVLIPIIGVIFLASFVTSVPSRVGERVTVENWIYSGLDRVLDLDLMRQFRDDIFYRIRPHLDFVDDIERWWVIREMELARERNNRALQSGEYTLVFFLAVAGIVIENQLYGIPVSVILSILALALSGMVLVRVVTTRILAFEPDLYLEESTHDLSVRMAFNRSSLSKGSSVAIAILTLLVTASGGRGYDLGLEFVEIAAAMTYPKSKDRWRDERSE